MISKQEFLAEHNRLSPKNLQATPAMLVRFQEEKRSQLKDDSWSIEKLRIPFITWLLSLPTEEIDQIKWKKEKPKFRNYPETKIS
jgi:hypothetical protein